MYIMGVDGGGTKTYAVITDERGNLIGEGMGGGANHQSVGMERALGEITRATGEALFKAGLTHEDIAFVQYGLSGADRQKDFDIILPALETLPFEKWDVVCDTMEGLRTGSKDYTGVVLVCGTGTNAAGRNRKGETVQTGGFGYLMGDYSGGAQLATEAFRRTIRSWELREKPTLLTERVPAFLGFGSVEELFHYYLDHDIHHVPASLAKVVHDAALEGDSVAIDLLRESGTELGLAAVSVMKRLRFDLEMESELDSDLEMDSKYGAELESTLDLDSKLESEMDSESDAELGSKLGSDRNNRPDAGEEMNSVSCVDSREETNSVSCADVDRPVVPIVLVGSILQKGKNAVLLSALENTIKREQEAGTPTKGAVRTGAEQVTRSSLEEVPVQIPDFELVIPKVEPVYGAVLLAMDRLHIPVTEEVERNLEDNGGYRNDGK
ncbi:N-acetylglucosamine kinase [Evansella tamaricis]|uniref:N-acetylglucosamine kinase n=1 Tax=Evansella tamaricis TaxID=2069301 RepID=UPI001FE50F90|nr:BadF/BadG/BcrA/BcrD ATPase family protein [Evansella tamaricis]